jgi:hypothetical protein
MLKPAHGFNVCSPMNKLNSTTSVIALVALIRESAPPGVIKIMTRVCVMACENLFYLFPLPIKIIPTLFYILPHEKYRTLPPNSLRDKFYLPPGVYHKNFLTYKTKFIDNVTSHTPNTIITINTMRDYSYIFRVVAMISVLKNSTERIYDLLCLHNIR